MLNGSTGDRRASRSLLKELSEQGKRQASPTEYYANGCRPQLLSSREREVLSLVAEGFSNKRIARQLTISERTIKSHLTNIMNKLQASDRTHSVVIAARLGWLDLYHPHPEIKSPTTEC